VIDLIKIIISIAPVFIFLATLVIFDSYKLVRLRSIVQAILIGGLAGVACFFITTLILGRLDWNLDFYTRTISPVLEESAKAVYLVLLMRMKKIGFMVDGAIYGFAIGAGFASIENIDYLVSLQSSNLFLWIIRGFGTAVMHGGTTCMMAILVKSFSERQPKVRLYHFLPGLVVAIVIHSFFNHIPFDPRIMTVVQLVLLPGLITIIFVKSEKMLRDWLELGMDTDVVMLDVILKGQISDTKIGRYLESMKSKFPGEILADMLCYMRIHLELAIRDKGLLLIQGEGFEIPVDPEVKEKLKELKYLEKSIGKTGKLALSPVLQKSTRDLWQMVLVKRG